MKRFTLIPLMIVAASFICYGQTEELLYDNGTVTDFQELVPERVFAVRMSPTSACEVRMLKYHMKKDGLSEGKFAATIYDWENTEPSEGALYEGLSFVIDSGWKEVDIIDTHVFTGDFVVGYTPLDAAAYLAVDSSMQDDRNWILDISNATWTEDTARIVLIRAVVEYTSTGEIVELEGKAINVYPNPATDMVRVEVRDDVNRISMINMVGETVYNAQNIEPGVKNIDISEFKSGVYIMRIDSESRSNMQKIIIN